MDSNPWATTATTTTTTTTDDDWSAAWPAEDQPKVSPPAELLVRHCEQVSQQIWPEFEPTHDQGWKSGLDGLSDITALLDQLAPSDLVLAPTVQFSSTATAKAMNEALKLTRHLPASANSPLSRLLASRGSLEWQKSIRTKQDVVPETSSVGWRVLEKEHRLGTVDESKQKRASVGLLSFWNRRAASAQATLVESSVESAGIPAKTSSENAKSVPPPSSRAASPPKTPVASVPPPPPPDFTPPASSVVSRFLNRFSRTKSSQNGALALSSEDLEFLSDIVPSASDPPDEDINGILGTLTGPGSSSSLPPKLPPLIPPPPKQPSRSSSPLRLDGARMAGTAPTTGNDTQGTQRTPEFPTLTPSSPKPATSSSHTQIPLSPNNPTSSTVIIGSAGIPTQKGLQSSSRSNLGSPSLTSPLSIPPLLPPPPFSPSQTPRPDSIPPNSRSSTIQNSNPSSFHDPYESDDEFTAFTSFPPLDSYPPLRSPSPPSPPPRHTYERKHYPSSPSVSSILSPESQSSVDRLFSTRVSTSLDDFDEFVSPPPLPAKSHLPYIDTCPAHTPSQIHALQNAHHGLMTDMSPIVGDAERQRMQALVDHAAARSGLSWPASPASGELPMRAIPPPLASTSTSPRSLIGEDRWDLLGDGDAFLGGIEALPPPLGAFGVDSMGTSHVPVETAGGSGRELGLSGQRSSPPSTFASATARSFSSVGASSLMQPTKPKQTGGLSAQDLSFFEGL